MNYAEIDCEILYLSDDKDAILISTNVDDAWWNINMEYWIPKSLIKDVEDVAITDTVIEIQEWFAIQEELV